MSYKRKYNIVGVKYFKIRDNKLFVKFDNQPEKFLTKGKVSLKLIEKKRFKGGFPFFLV